MIGVKDQNDKRDAWHHGGWIVKMVLWILLVVLMFFLPNVVISVYGKSFFHNYDIKLIVIFCCFSLARVRGEFTYKKKGLEENCVNLVSKYMCASQMP